MNNHLFEGKYELDSLFHGLILVKDKNFIYNLSVGGDGFEYFYDYENILKTINKKFAFWNNKIIKSTKINQHLTLELSRLKFNKKENQSQESMINKIFHVFTECDQQSTFLT